MSYCALVPRYAAKRSLARSQAALSRGRPSTEVVVVGAGRHRDGYLYSRGLEGLSWCCQLQQRGIMGKDGNERNIDQEEGGRESMVRQRLKSLEPYIQSCRVIARAAQLEH
jgi:hypothetical protein